MVTKLYLAIIFILAFLNTAFSNDDIGYKYYEKGLYDKAIEIWSKEIKQGNKEAMYNMGLLYYFGKGVDKDLSVAFTYCKQAAFKGSARAQNNLAYMYMKGMGTKKSYISAYAWSLIAIKNGYSSHGIRDNASMNLTPGMLSDANKLITKINKEIRYE
tara:strand:- start:1327 stop:1800 length:474 start_codon:yes stop_codon:yes gene_type:complete